MTQIEVYVSVFCAGPKLSVRQRIDEI